MTRQLCGQQSKPQGRQGVSSISRPASEWQQSRAVGRNQQQCCQHLKEVSTACMHGCMCLPPHMFPVLNTHIRTRTPAPTPTQVVVQMTYRYILSDQLHLNSYQVLRGAGRDYTVLRFTKSLVDLRGWGTNYTAGRGKSPHTWAGAMITNQQQKGVFGPTVNLHLGSVAQPAKRGDTRLYLGSLVRNTSSAELLFTPGQWYTLALAENAEVSTGLLLLRLLQQDAAGQFDCCRQGPQARKRPHGSCCCGSGIGGKLAVLVPRLAHCVRNALTRLDCGFVAAG